MKSTVYIIIALAAAVAGFALYQFGIAPKVAQTVAPTTVAAEAAQVAPQSSKVIPADLPDFSLADIEGTSRSIRSWDGKSMIVNFWATWCAPCRREIPLLQKIQQNHATEGFQVVGVAVDFRDDVIKYAKEIGIDYPVLIGEQDGLDAVNTFNQGSLGFPFTVFTDNQKRIVAFHLGEIREAEADILLDAVRRVNSGELTPQTARSVVEEQLAKLKSPSA